MAVLKVQRIYICGLKKERKQILEFVQRRGLIEINDMFPEDSVFHRSDVSAARIDFERTIASAGQAIDILNSYVPEKKSPFSSLKGKRVVSSNVYDQFIEKYDPTIVIVKRINSLSKDIAENKAEIIKLNTQAEMLYPWLNLDIVMNYEGTEYTKCFIGTLPKQWILEEIYEKLSDHMPLSIEIISAAKEQTCIFILCPRNRSDEVYHALREMDFSLPGASFERSPAEQVIYIKKQISDAQNSIENAVREIKSYEEKKDDILFLQDYDTLRSEKYEVMSHLLQSDNAFVMTGYIPERDVKSLSDELVGRFHTAIETEQPSEDEDVPVILNNNGFAGPLEDVVNAYSPPGKGEIDPTMAMSLFYYLLFGIMLSDAGYGILMVCACAVCLIKFGSNMEDSLKRFLKMFFFCGISTIFWGIMFGSYFGDIIDVISETYFGTKISIPALWFIPMNEPMRMLTFSMTLGIIHLFTGMGIKMYQLIKQKDYIGMIYDVLFWFVLLISSLILLLSMPMIVNLLGVNFIIPSHIGKFAGILAVISSFGIIATNGRESRNPLKRFLKGLYALYGISGYLSDVLSYSRLLALGLATGIIAMVINKMAAMVGGFAYVGPVIFLIIVLAGHTMNFGINALGAYVHTNRLQYVEFFGKFYSGGGRLFKPFKEKTKYYKIK